MSKRGRRKSAGQGGGGGTDRPPRGRPGGWLGRDISRPALTEGLRGLGEAGPFATSLAGVELCEGRSADGGSRLETAR